MFKSPRVKHFVFLAIFACLTSTPLPAFQDGYIYAIQSNFELPPKYTLVRKHINSGTIERLGRMYESKGRASLNEYFGYNFVIDARLSRLYLQARNNDTIHKWYLSRYDLKTGERLGTTEENQGRFYGMQLNPLNGLLYTYEIFHVPQDEAASHFGLTIVHPESGELTRLSEYKESAGLTNPAVIDYVNERYIYGFGSANSLSSFGLEDGDFKGIVRTDKRMPAVAFDPISAKVYAVKIRNGHNSDTDLLEMDAAAGTLKQLQAFILPGTAEYGEIRDGQFNHGTGEFIFRIATFDGASRYSDFYAVIPGMQNKARWITRIENCVGAQLFIHPINDLFSTRVEGQVRVDVNENCSLDASDLVLARQEVNFTPGDYTTYTDSEGRYTITLPAGEYRAEIGRDHRWKNVCSENSRTIIINNSQGEISNVNLLATVANETEQVDVSLSASNPKAGRTALFHATITNTGALPFSGPVRFVSNRRLEGVFSSPGMNHIRDYALDWNIEEIPPGGQIRLEIGFKRPQYYAGENNALCGYIELANAVGADLRIAAHHCQIISKDNSTIPNRLEPSGMLRAEFTDAAQTRLRYTAHIDNLGDLGLNEVQIADELEYYLDENSMRLVASSHPALAQVVGNTVQIDMQDLGLEGRLVNPANSKAFVSYEVDVIPGLLTAGNIITNSIQFYFENDRQVYSNTVRNVIGGVVTELEETQDLSSIAQLTRLQLVDNGEYLLQWAESVYGHVQVYSSLGREVRSATIRHQRDLHIDLRGQPSGAYYIRVEIDREFKVFPIYLTN